MKKVFKKALSVVLSAALVFTGVSINETKQVSAAVNIDVSTASDLANLGATIANTTGDVVVNIKNNIVVTGNDWEGISFEKTGNYSVTILGNGYSIGGINNTNVFASVTSDNKKSFATGLFSKVVVKNFRVDDLTITGANLQSYYNEGALIGFANTDTLEINNCKVYNSNILGDSYFGGMVGYSQSATETVIKDCTVNAATTIKYVNYAVGSSDGKFIGGVIGYMPNGSISNANNYAKLDLATTINNDQYAVGGIIGGNCTKNEYTIAATITISDCTNSGNITLGNAFGIGGIIGFGKANITNATNKGTITVKSGENVGGIIGFGKGTITDSTNTGAVTVEGNDEAPYNGDATNVAGIAGKFEGDISNSDNSGNITGDKYVGGIAGIVRGVITDTKNSGDITGNYCVGGNVGCADAENSKVSNAENTGKIIVDDTDEKAGYIGGNVGAINGDVDNLTNSGDIVDVNGGAVEGYCVGGNVGWMNGDADKLANTGEVDTENSQYVGGNVGYIEGKSTDFDNKGDVFADDGSEYVGGNIGGSLGDVKNLNNEGKVEAMDGRYVGGNVGRLEGNAENLTNKGDAVFGMSNVGGNIGYVDGDTTDLDNSAKVIAEEGINIGGNIGNQNSGHAKDLDNSGNITAGGCDNVGGNIGLANGTSEDLNNSGNVGGRDNVGGNIGENNGTTENNYNEGDVNGNNNVGGNIGHNGKDGDASGLTNDGDVSGKNYVGGNVGLNEGKVDGATNNGGVTGKGEPVDGNVNNVDPGTSSNTTDNSGKKEDEDGTEVVDPTADAPANGEYYDPATGMTYKVVPAGSGAIYIKNDGTKKVVVTAKPVQGYKFTGWGVDNTTVASGDSSKDSKITVNINKGAVITANFEKLKEGEEIGTTVNGDSSEVKFEDGLVIAITPAKGGSINFVSGKSGNITLTAVAADGYVFDKWTTTGSAKLATGLDATSATVTFTYTPYKAAKITAVFKAVTADGPKAGTTVKDKKYIYKVTKAGSTDGSIVGTVKVVGLRKKSLKTLKIAAKVKIGGVTYKVTAVGNNAFKGNKKATKLYVGKNVKTIGKMAFAKMKKLKSVVINSKVLKSIGKKAFYGDKKLKKVTIKSKKLKKIGKKAFTRKGGKKLTIKVPKAKKKAYKKLIKKSKANKVVVK